MRKPILPVLIQGLLILTGADYLLYIGNRNNLNPGASLIHFYVFQWHGQNIQSLTFLFTFTADRNRYKTAGGLIVSDCFSIDEHN